MLYIDGLCSTSSAPNGLNEWLWLNGYLPSDEFLHIQFYFIYLYVTPCPLVMHIVSTTFIIFECWHIFLALLNLYLRDPSLERKRSFFLKVVLAVTLGFTSYNLGTFWVLTGIKIWISVPTFTTGSLIHLWKEKHLSKYNLVTHRMCPILEFLGPLLGLEFH